MNKDLISRSALERELLEKGFYPAIVRAAIEKAPAVDAESMKHGHWEFLRMSANGNVFRCSKCGRLINALSLDNYPYCHCGAKMDEEGINGN